jgi:hypothetical protein
MWSFDAAPLAAADKLIEGGDCQKKKGGRRELCRLPSVVVASMDIFLL